MHTLYLVCLVPLVLVYGGNDGQDKYGQDREAFFKMFGKIAMMGKGTGGGKGMMMGGGSDEEGGWGKKTWGKGGDDSNEEGDKKKWGRDNHDDGGYMGGKKWRKHDENDWEDSDEEMKGHGDMMKGKGRGHGRNHMMGWKKMGGYGSSEEDIQKAHVKFYGKLAMMKVKQGMGEWMKHAEDMHRWGKMGSKWDKNSHEKEDNEDDNEKHDDDNEKHEDDNEKHEDKDQMTEEGSVDMITKKLKMGMKQMYMKEPKQLAKFITLSFLKMCECDGDDATVLLKNFVRTHSGDEKDMEKEKKSALPIMPDFGDNATAKIEFLQKLTKEQRTMLFGRDLVKNMCNSAKAYLVKSKEFYEKYFPMNEDDSNTTTTETP